jgi:predicted nucleic acid-binding protein
MLNSIASSPRSLTGPVRVPITASTNPPPLHRVTVSRTHRLCRDPGDDKFLECAERARAVLLITGDKDLLPLRTHGRTRIVTPAACLKL